MYCTFHMSMILLVYPTLKGDLTERSHILLLVQKSQGQPPFGCIKPCKSWDICPYQLVQDPDSFHQQYEIQLDTITMYIINHHISFFGESPHLVTFDLLLQAKPHIPANLPTGQCYLVTFLSSHLTIFGVELYNKCL